MSLVLDPSEVAVNRAELGLFDGPIQPTGRANIDWGDALIEAHLVEGEIGSRAAGFRIPNRVITIPLLVMEHGVISFREALSDLQAKVALFQREGGWLKRGRDNGDLFADVVNASLSIPDSWVAHTYDIEPDVVLTLECLPDFYGEEREQPSVTGANSELQIKAAVEGHSPARMRLTLEADTDQNGLLFAARSRQLDSPTTRLAYYPSALTKSSVATFSGTRVETGGLMPEYQIILSSEMPGTGHMTHVGPHRVWAELETDDEGIHACLQWAVGDNTQPSRNAEVELLPLRQVVDLGEAYVDEMPADHSWRWEILARTDGDSDTDIGSIKIHRVYIFPTAETYGRIVAVDAPKAGLVVLGVDLFSKHTPGVLHGKAAPAGGNWSTAGAAGDFSIPDPTNGWLERSPGGDANDSSGRYARLGTGTAAAVRVRAYIDSPATTLGEFPAHGLFARYQDTDNWFMARIERFSAFGAKRIIRCYKKVNGTVTQVGASSWWFFATRGRHTLDVDADGNFWVWAGMPRPGLPLQVAQGRLMVFGQDPDLAGAGALATGGYGLYDAYTGGTLRRRYGQFLVQDLTGGAERNAVLYEGRPGTLRSDGYFREGLSNTLAEQPIFGRDPRLPVSGLEDREVEFFCVVSRGNFEAGSHNPVDIPTGTLAYRPTFLTTP